MVLADVAVEVAVADMVYSLVSRDSAFERRATVVAARKAVRSDSDNVKDSVVLR